MLFLKGEEEEGEQKMELEEEERSSSSLSSSEWEDVASDEGGPPDNDGREVSNYHNHQFALLRPEILQFCK